MSVDEEAAVGIDYGTTSSLAAVSGRDQDLEVVPVRQRPDGPLLDHLPGYLYFPRTRRVIVGEVARRFYTLKPHKVIRSVKRDMTRTWTIGRTTYSAGDLVRFVLREILVAVRERFPHAVRSAVLTVPSTFGQAERRTLLAAASAASRWLREVTLLDEPLAAFIAYLDEARLGFCQPPPDHGRVMVFDMGGGTTDISVLEVRRGRGGAFRARVLGVWSDARLGGDDFDTALASELAARWMSAAPGDRGPLTESERRFAGGRMLAAAERAKMELGSTGQPVRVRLDGLPGGPDLEIEVTPGFYGRTVDVQLGRVTEALRHALHRTGLPAEAMDIVVLAGGMGRTELVRGRVESFFGRPPVVLEDPVTAVVRGACLHHMAQLGLEARVLVEPLRPILSHTLGLRLSGGRLFTLLEAGTELPARRTLEGCLMTPHTGCAAVRVPVYVDGESGDSRLLATLTLSSPVALPGGQPVGIELEADINKLVSVRAYLEDGSSRGRSLQVTGL
jgi:molecular chaperone DnaK